MYVSVYVYSPEEKRHKTERAKAHKTHIIPNLLNINKTLFSKKGKKKVIFFC